MIAMLSKIWILLERLAGLNPSLPKSPSTFISTHRWHTSGILHCISANVLIDTCLALCRQSEETLCNILSLNYRESQQRRNNIALKLLLYGLACKHPLGSVQMVCYCLRSWSVTNDINRADASLLKSLWTNISFWNLSFLNKFTPTGHKPCKCSPVHKWPPFGNFTIAALGTRNEYHIPSQSMEALARKYLFDLWIRWVASKVLHKSKKGLSSLWADDLLL